MASNHCWRITVPLLLVCGLFVCTGQAIGAGSDPQQDSVADAARRAREQKKNAAKPAKVVTDDDMPKSKSTDAGVNVGAPPQSDAQPPNQAAVSKTEAADKTAESGDDKNKVEDPEIKAMKEQIAQVSKTLDLQQRELALDRDAYYSKPDFSNDTAGKAKLDAEQSQISKTQDELDGLKTKLAAMEELKGIKKSAGEPTGTGKPAPNTPQ